MRRGLESEKVASSIQLGIVEALTSPANCPEKHGGILQNRVDPRAHGPMARSQKTTWTPGGRGLEP